MASKFHMWPQRCGCRMRLHPDGAPWQRAMSLLHMEVGLGRIGHAGADVEADMGRLVVA